MRAVVLGLAPSALLYEPDNRLLIGVNDAEKYHKVNHLIVIDPPRAFSKERLNIIKKSTPELFLSQLNDWNFIKNYKQIKLASCRSQLDEINYENVYPYSIMSPYVAIIHAYKLGAKEITLYGVDITDHETLSNPIKKERVLTDIKALNLFLQRRGIELNVFNKSSLLSQCLKYLTDK